MCSCLLFFFSLPLILTLVKKISPGLHEGVDGRTYVVRAISSELNFLDA